MDQNFTCDSSSKTNEVTLIGIKKENGDTIAVLKYNISEYVHGNFYMPSFSGNGQEKSTMMDFSYKGIAEFSVEKGRWIKYDGIMNLSAEGAIVSQKKERYALLNISER
jgi:hypothetical protein